MTDVVMTDNETQLLDLAEENPDALLANGFEAAFIGVCRRFGQPPLAAYDVAECLRILVDRDEMSYEEAEEYFEFNVIGAWMGEHTPVFVVTSSAKFDQRTEDDVAVAFEKVEASEKNAKRVLGVLAAFDEEDARGRGRCAPSLAAREADTKNIALHATTRWTAELWDGSPDCEHEVVDSPGGGVVCVRCKGWCCL